MPGWQPGKTGKMQMRIKDTEYLFVKRIAEKVREILLAIYYPKFTRRHRMTQSLSGMFTMGENNWGY